MKYIAVDAGSSFIKFALLDLESASVSGLQNMPPPEPITGTSSLYYELDAEEMFSRVKAGIDSMLQDGLEVKGILLSTQMHGFLVLDEQNRLLTPYVSWQDQRCLSAAKGGRGTYFETLKEMLDPVIFGKSGIAPKPGLALCNLYTWKEENAGVQSESLRFCTLGSYLIFRLTGMHGCHLTNAAASGLVDIEQQKWNRPLLEALGLEGMLLPEICHEAQPCGYYQYNGLQIPVYPDIGDHQAAVLGSMTEFGTEINVNIGTAAQLTKIENRIVKGPFEVRPYFDGQVMHTVSRIPGGRNLKVLVDLIVDVGQHVFNCSLSDKQVWERVLQLPMAGTSGLVVKTGFFGDAFVEQGAIEGIKSGNLTTDAIFMAAYHNIAETYAQVKTVLCPDSTGARSLVFSGGVSWKNKPLREIIVERIGLPGRLSSVPDEVFAGLFRLALRCQGICKTIEETKVWLQDDQEKGKYKLRFD